MSLVSAAGCGPGRAEFFTDPTDDTSRVLEWTMPESRFVDVAALLVVTTASLRTARALHPAGSWEPRRFRPNLVVDVEEDEWVEDHWLGRSLQVGTVTLAPTGGCHRCTMVTREQPGTSADQDVFRVLARHHGARLGVLCEVITTGCVSVGDRLALASPGMP